jgi:hypothetical protein
MSKVPEKIQEIAADGVADGLHIVSEEALVAEQAVRSLDNLQVGYIGLGVAIGAATGALVAFKVAYSRAETKFSKMADDEIAEMRLHYQEKAIALEAQANKEDLEALVSEKGYKTPEDPAPMAVAPPNAVVEAAEELKNDQPAEAEVIKEPEVRNVFETAKIDHEWDYHEERRRRTPDSPYVIHYDERHEFEGYSDLTLTYYEADDVLCNERDEIVDPDERDKLVGESNLERFGHGSNDAAIVFIRNDQKELTIEVVKSPNSYAEEVHGLRHTGYGGNLERMRTRERDLPDDE